MKVPRLFREQIKGRRFEKKILRRVYIESERNFLLGLYTQEADGGFRRPTELSSDEIKRLRSLARSIKKNKGVVRTGKFSLLALIIVALLVFNFLFKNRLLENALESGLQRVFEARAEVTGLDFRIFQGRLSIDQMAVADKEQPLKNLFELGTTAVHLNTAELLKAKFVIRNLECQEIRWNTQRETSGALPEAGTEAAPQSQAPEKTRSFSLGLGNLDARALLAEQFEKLESPARLRALNGRLREMEEQWSETVGDLQQDVEQLAERIEVVRKIEVSSLSAIPELRQAVSEIGDTAAVLQKAKEDASGARAKLSADFREIEAARSDVSQTIEKDVAFLKAFTDFSSGQLKNLASSMAGAYLEQALGRFYGYARRAKEVSENLIARKKEKTRKKRESRGRRSGTDIAFPTKVYPRFLLERAAVSVGSRETSRFAEGLVQNISSNPDLIDRPITFLFAQQLEERALSVEGLVDSRSSREKDFSVEISVNNYPLEISKGLESLKWRSLSARYNLSTELVRGDSGLSGGDGRVEGTGVLELEKLQIQPAEGKQDLLSRTLSDTLGGAEDANVEFSYTVSGEGSVQLQARSNLDELLARALGAQLKLLASEHEGKLRAELEDRLEAELADNEVLYGALKDLQGLADGNLSDLNSYESVLEQKRAAVQNRIDDLKKKAGETIKEELKKLPLPKLGF